MVNDFIMYAFDQAVGSRDLGLSLFLVLSIPNSIHIRLLKAVAGYQYVGKYYKDAILAGSNKQKSIRKILVTIE